jgi:hypothetical protein
MFRVSQRGEGIDDADTIDGAREIVQCQSPGRYDVDEIRAKPFPSGYTSRFSAAWGAERISTGPPSRHGGGYKPCPSSPITVRRPLAVPIVGLAMMPALS